MTDFGINEYFIFSVFLLFGLAAGLVLYFILRIKNKIFLSLVQVIFAALNALVFFLLSLKFCYGLISTNMFVGSLIGGILGYCLIGKLFGKLFLVCYTFLSKLSKELDKVLVIRRKHGKSKTKVNT